MLAKILITLGIIFISIAVVATVLKKDTWLGIYYPDSIQKSEFLTSAPFKSFGECVDWSAKLLVRKEGASTECGRDCEYNQELKSFVCEELVK